jgi:hypothetical protein
VNHQIAFGTSLARGYFNNDSYEDMAVGSPGLAVGVTEVDPDEGNPFSFNGQHQLLTSPTPASAADFGTILARLDEDTVAVGAPGVGGVGSRSTRRRVRSDCY